jgi:hypothetical protein
MYRLRHSVQRRVEYALLVCVLGLAVEVLQHFTTVNLRPLSFSIAGIAVVIGLSAWPLAFDHRRSRQRVRWLKANEDRTRQLFPGAPDPWDTTPPLALSARSARKAG